MSGKNKARLSSITLVGNNTLVYVPDFKDKKSLKKMRSEFGWMGEDYRQVVMNENIENAIPKEEDFLPFWFRHISATTVGGGSWKATEFPEKVLKAGMPLLAFKPSYVNHEMETSNIIGGIGNVKWTGKQKLADGTIVPPGIDAPIWVDGKLHPDICRKLAAFPVPHIQSVSVTVTYEWEPSHVFENREGDEDIWLFENRIGQVVDGEMVRRIATKIIDFYETSLVWLGADPFAKILDTEGKPLNIEKSAIVGMSKFADDPLTDLYKNTGRYFVNDSCFVNLNKLDLQRQVFENVGKTENYNRTMPKQSSSNSETKNNLKMDVLEFIAQQLNVKPEEVTVDVLKGFSFVKADEHSTLIDLQKVVGTKSDYEKLKADKDKAETDLQAANDKVTNLESEATNNKPLVEFASGHKDHLKDEATRFYKLSCGEKKPDDQIVSLIEKAADDNDFKLLNSLLVQYGGKAFGEFEGECKECGSKEIKLRSTESTEEGEETKEFDFPNLSEAFRK